NFRLEDNVVDGALSEETGRLIESSGAVFIAPISKSPIKDWPAANYSALVRMILERNRHVVLLGTADQHDALDEIANLGVSGDRRATNLAGSTPWAVLPKLFQ